MILPRFIEHFQKLCGLKKVAVVFNRHAKTMKKKKGLAVKNHRHD